MKMPKILLAVTTVIALSACENISPVTTALPASPDPAPTETKTTQPVELSVTDAVEPSRPALTPMPLVTTVPSTIPSAIPSASPSPTHSMFPMTYHKHTVNRIWSNNQYAFYTVTGSCVIYQNLTYCWDDGLRQNGNIRNSYWDLGYTSGSSTFGCSENGIATDAAITPLLMTAHIQSIITACWGSTANAGASMSVVLSDTAVTVQCYEDNGFLQCGDFVVDLNQVHL